MYPEKVRVGSTAKPRLPRAAVERRAPSFATSRILVVDADRQTGFNLAFMLSARRYDEVRVVRSARRAIAISEQFHPEVVLLDLELPDGGGISLAHQLLRMARPRRPRLIALTNLAEHLTREDARVAGFERFLLKPVSQEELDRVLGIVNTAV